MQVGEALLEPLVGISEAEETASCCCSGRPTEPCLLEGAGKSAVRLSGC